MRRWAVAPGAAVAFLVAGGSVAWLAADEGGYFPEAWGAPTLVLLWVVMLALILGASGVPGPLSAGLFGAAAALVAWIGFSALWSTVPSQSVLELERSLLYVAALVAALLFARGRADVVLGGVLAGIAALGSYALAVRLLPDVFGVAERLPFQTAALHEPIGYSNALGAFAAVGILLALGFSVDGRSEISRSLAAIVVVPLATVVYFAFSRGAWLALAVGLVAVMALARARGRLARGWLVGAVPFASLAISFSSNAGALNRISPTLEEARREGLLLLIALLLLAAASAAARLVAPALDPRRGRIRSLLALAAALTIIAVAALTFSRDTPMRPATALGTQRGTSVALGRRDELWRGAWNAFEKRPVAGFGAGSFEQYWLEHRERPWNVRDAHNLYVESLAELGAPGLLLVAALFGIPLWAAVVARDRPLIAAAFGAVTFYLAHAVVDWDWEIPAMTVPVLLVAAALVSAADEGGEPLVLTRNLRVAGVIVCLAASVFSVVALVGNRAAALAEQALRVGAAEQAEAEARRASRWAPWSSHPLRTLGNAQLAQNDPEAARTTIRRALAKEDQDWRLWLALAVATEGSERRRAFERAHELNPLSPRLAALRPVLGIRSGFGGDS